MEIYHCVGLSKFFQFYFPHHGILFYRERKYLQCTTNKSNSNNCISFYRAAKILKLPGKIIRRAAKSFGIANTTKHCFLFSHAAKNFRICQQIQLK
jgi:hypothetical protein